METQKGGLIGAGNMPQSDGFQKNLKVFNGAGDTSPVSSPASSRSTIYRF